MLSPNQFHLSLEERDALPITSRKRLLLERLPVILLDIQQLDRLVSDVLRTHLEFLDQFPRRPGIAKTILNTDRSCNDGLAIEHRTTGDHVTYPPSQRTDLVFLGGQHKLRFASRPR